MPSKYPVGTLLRLDVVIPPIRLGHEWPIGTPLISTGNVMFHTEEQGQHILWVRPDQPMLGLDAFPVYTSEVSIWQ